ncbi:SDR family oxidoreductase [Cellulosimicrobium funkei]|nr:SDR family oxidoreductase [Cellulosimicrobium funkei]
MDLQIEGRTALVFGASGGLGGATARSLAAEGANLVLAGQNSDKLENLAQSLSTLGVTALPIVWNLSDLEDVGSRAAAVRNEVGEVDILINITGGPPPTPVAGQQPRLWRDQFTAMVLSVITITDAFLPAMRNRGWGRIITATSSGAVAPIPNLGISNTLRSSLQAWSKTLSGEIGVDGVTSNVVIPGRVGTSRVEQLDAAKASREGRTTKEVRDSSLASIPLGRYGKPEEFGDVVTFLASERGGYITGSTLRVDGGYIPSI